MHMTLDTFNDAIIVLARRYTEPLARFALFVSYYWFGLLKVLGQSPASGLVADLLERTIPFMAPDTFIYLFGIFECVIGILFLKRGLEKLVIPLFAIHMFTTFGPLVMLPAATWSSFGVPTLEGQYILKNFALMAAAFAIVSGMRTRSEKVAEV